MSHKKICFIHTETTGLHLLGNEKVYKKNLFGFARLVMLSWTIGYRSKNKFVKEKSEQYIIKPRCLYIDPDCTKFHGITHEIALEKGTEIESVLDKFINDIKTVDIIVSHSLEFHLKTVQAELVRYNKPIDFNKYILIDINSFKHGITPYNLPNLSKKLLDKEITNKTMILPTIIELFIKLYNDYESKILSK
jgi:DNA polymerase III epsilon subunit-like protein